MNKLKLLLLLGIMLFPMCVFSQVKTTYADELAIDVSGLKLGYVYTFEQLTSVLGIPTDTSSWEADFGKEYELCFGKDIIRYDDKEAGLYSFVLQTNIQFVLMVSYLKRVILYQNCEPFRLINRK